MKSVEIEIYRDNNNNRTRKKNRERSNKKKQNNSDNKIVLCFSERKIGKAK
jgi:hypothetical protein